ncbi:MAG TPA: tyrosine-type recombinase/integrase [Chloroflexota bacterium]|nr:tyrosine-type recombinase/integrase [Chloroflexota bacterium]
MLKVAAPQIKEVRPLVIVTEQQWQRLLRSCEGKEFTQRRDMAIVRLFLATPMRLSELADLRVQDVDFQNGKVRVLGKGGQYRDCPVTAKAEAAVDRYLRRRAEHRHAAAPWLWLGPRGRMTHSGVYQMIKDQARAAGFPELHPHEFRATFAANWLRDGRTEQGLMRIAGWSSRAMIQRYTTLAADELAAEEYRRAQPGDAL